MANHDILLNSVASVADLGHAPMEEDDFRKMADAVKRPVTQGVSVFRPVLAAPNPVEVTLPEVEPQVPMPLALSPPRPGRVWDSLNPATLDEVKLLGKGLFTNPQQSPATTHFDMLRTRILQAMQDHGWKRIAITSPTHGCGKSFVAANLALSLARRPSSRTILLDLELRQPGLARMMGLSEIGALRDFLNGDQPLESHFRRIGRTLALGLNSVPVPDAAEVLQEPATAETLDAMMAQLQPELLVIDAPPALVADDVLSLLPQVDAVLLIIDGTRTTAKEVRACERLFEGRCPLMGVVLNRSQDFGLGRYRYGMK
ncbi:CpsD/CapB family tyrosine-protein kinase [Pseudorhodobacter sp.]|uniref:CpsD/CapB family tyrosine-protein kinase n=1 Tax=Pseudorhodobacter sp. TaxID=1934400 RepID=UPI002646FF00|nr:CpsD/CapB family tyrosine-protein kinase [Pseudorhodobacter sp.]MDN5788936.1 CpsD/CapB family tyrosine-protein kinase [Pseudorhodobacter sp.]